MNTEQILAAARMQLALREGKRLRVYPDSLGKPTVGIGHLVTERDGLKIGDTITEERCSQLFDADVQSALNAAMIQAAETGIETNEWVAALVSVNYQLGTGWTRKFPFTWQALKARNYDRAIYNLNVSHWATQTPVRVADFIAAIEALKGEMIS